MAKRVWLVIGHETPTDAEPDPEVQGKLDNGISVLVVESRVEAENALYWYQDGKIWEISV